MWSNDGGDDANNTAEPEDRVSKANTAKSGKGGSRSEKLNPFSRVWLFVREVIAELRKVIWPTRKELITYTGVVVVFVLIMASIIAVYDYVFSRGVLAVFGGE